jgi:hypothetical protein
MDEVLASMQDEAEDLKHALHGYLDETRLSKMTSEDPRSNLGRENSKHDPFSIWFMPETILEKRSFGRLLTEELTLRGLETTGDITVHRV